MKADTYNQYSQKEENISKYFKVLGHPARVAIIKILLKKQTCICGDIVDELPLSQSTVSQHLKELKESGLIRGDISGVKTCYCIDEKEWQKASKLMNEFLSTPFTIKKCC